MANEGKYILSVSYISEEEWGEPTSQRHGTSRSQSILDVNSVVVQFLYYVRELHRLSMASLASGISPSMWQDEIYLDF